MSRKRKPRSRHKRLAAQLAPAGVTPKVEKNAPEPSKPVSGNWLDGEGRDAKESRKDVGLIQRATSEKWNVPPELKDKCIAYLESAMDNSGDFKIVVAAVNVVAKLTAQDKNAGPTTVFQQNFKLDNLDDLSLERLEAIYAELQGIRDSACPDHHVEN